jgi:predicted Ser/Thr protein kinase
MYFHIDKGDYRTIQEVEKDCDYQLKFEKAKFREKESENKTKIKQLLGTLEREKDKRLDELSNYTTLKKKVIKTFSSIPSLMVII